MMAGEQWGGYDSFAENILAPIFPLYAQKIIERTGVDHGQLLDLGSGGGHLGFALMDAGNFDHVTFADASSQQLNNAYYRGQERGYFEDECTFVEVDAVDLRTFYDDTFDLVVSRSSMHLWSDPMQALREIYRVLKPNGYAYVGGGIGTNARLSNRVDYLMRVSRGEETGGPGGDNQRPHRRKFDHPAQRQACIDLFEELACSFAIINSKAEGGWYIFCKDGYQE